MDFCFFILRPASEGAIASSFVESLFHWQKFQVLPLKTIEGGKR